MKPGHKPIAVFAVVLLALAGLLLADSPAEPEKFAPGIISTDGFELGLSFSPDGHTAYFSQIGEGFKTSVIVYSHFENGQWTQPQPISSRGPYRDLDVFLSPDGKKMFFQSDRPVEGTEAKDWDIWVSEKTPNGWSEPRNLGAPINTPATETFPVVTADGTLYFASDRPGGKGGDIYRSRFVNGRYTEPENIGAPVNTAEFDSNAYVAPDESYMILGSSNYPGHLGNGDLYISHNREGRWTPPQPVPGVNTEHREFAPSVSSDGKHLFFTSNRPNPGSTQTRRGDIYKVKLPLNE